MEDVRERAVGDVVGAGCVETSDSVGIVVVAEIVGSVAGFGIAGIEDFGSVAVAVAVVVVVAAAAVGSEDLDSAAGIAVAAGSLVGIEDFETEVGIDQNSGGTAAVVAEQKQGGHLIVEGSDSIQIVHESEKEQVVVKVYVVVHDPVAAPVASSVSVHVVVDWALPHCQPTPVDFESEDY